MCRVKSSIGSIRVCAQRTKTIYKYNTIHIDGFYYCWCWQKCFERNFLANRVSQTKIYNIVLKCNMEQLEPGNSIKFYFEPKTAMLL